MANILEVKDLCKTYIIDKRQNNVLRNISFEVEEGDMVAIMGPSGSGKSTLLYSVSGMDAATSGTVIFDGKDMTTLTSGELAQVRLNKMGFIFQQMYMMKNLTILDNIVQDVFKLCKGKKEKGGRDFSLPPEVQRTMPAAFCFFACCTAFSALRRRLKSSRSRVFS